MFVGGFDLSSLLGSGRASMLPLETQSLGLWVIAVDPAFIAGYQSIKNCGIWIDQLDHLPAVMTTSFFLIFSEHPWDKLRANLLHLQFLAKNCVYSSHTDIKLCTFCLWLPYSSHTSHHPSETLCLPWISYATQELMLEKQSEASHMWHFFQVLNRILLHIVLLKRPDVQIAFLNFTGCDNQVLVGCIPIPAVAVYLNLKS